ncbi:MAG TPA: hypothetical protein VGO62_08790, partial [Myxococcota bacterium]
MAVGVLVTASCAYSVPPTVGPPSAPFFGAVTLTKTPTTTSVELSFSNASSAPAACSGTTVGSCCVSSIPALDIPEGDKALIAVDAGRIDIEDG